MYPTTTTSTSVWRKKKSGYINKDVLMSLKNFIDSSARVISTRRASDICRRGNPAKHGSLSRPVLVLRKRLEFRKRLGSTSMGHGLMVMGRHARLHARADEDQNASGPAPRTRKRWNRGAEWLTGAAHRRVDPRRGGDYNLESWQGICDKPSCQWRTSGETTVIRRESKDIEVGGQVCGHGWLSIATWCRSEGISPLPTVKN